MDSKKITHLYIPINKRENKFLLFHVTIRSFDSNTESPSTVCPGWWPKISEQKNWAIF